MSLTDDAIVTDGTLDDCLDAVNDFVTTLNRYSPATIAVAMSVHLQCALCALVECDMCTPEQVRDFVRELDRDVCQAIGVSPP